MQTETQIAPVYPLGTPLEGWSFPGLGDDQPGFASVAAFAVAFIPSNTTSVPAIAWTEISLFSLRIRMIHPPNCALAGTRQWIFHDAQHRKELDHTAVFKSIPRPKMQKSCLKKTIQGR